MQTSPGAAYSSSRNQRLLMKANDKHYDVAEGDEDYAMQGATNLSDNASGK